MQSLLLLLTRNGSQRLIWIGALGAAAWLLGFGIEHEPLWLDETYSYAMAQHGFIDILHLTAKDVHPPLYYLILKATVGLFGSSSWALRLPSLVATLGLIALAAGPIRRLWGGLTAAVFAILVATSPGILCFAQEARMYAQATVFVTGAVVFGLLALREGRHRNFVWLGAFTWASAMTHYFGLIAVGVNGLGLLVVATVGARQRVKPFLVTLAVAAAFYVPWLATFARQVLRVSYGFWIPPTSWNLLTFGLVAPFTYKFEDVPYPWQALVAFGIVGVIVAVSLIQIVLRKTRPAFDGLGHLVCVFLMTLGVGLAYSKWVQPIFMPRYMMSCAGLLLLVTAIGLSRLPRLVSIMSAALLVGLGLPAWVRIHTEVFDGPFAILAKQVRDAGTSELVFLHNDVQALYPSWHAVPKALHVMVTPKDSPINISAGGVYDVTRLATTSELKGILDVHRRVWVVDAEPAGFHVDPSRIVEQKGWHQAGEPTALSLPMSWVRLKLIRFEKQ
jgi:4-amino-4-deoxy-L-arabinose transferase-like glycosyltransferase